MDKELRKIIPQTGSRPHQVDKLVLVRFANGQQQLLWIHIEIQSAKDPAFEERVYRYNSLVRARYGKQVISLAILADVNQNWCPDVFQHHLAGFELTMKFPICKLLDREQDLQDDYSVPAILLRAQLTALRERQNLDQRLATKWTLVRSLYEHGYSKQDIQQVFVFIDRMITLPKSLDLEFETQVLDYEKEIQMAVLSPFEQRAIDKGAKLVILRQSEKRFGAIPSPLQKRIEQLDQAGAEQLGIALLDFDSLQQIESWLDAWEKEAKL